MTIISWFLVNIHFSQSSVPSSKFLRSFLHPYHPRHLLFVCKVSYEAELPPSPISDGIFIAMVITAV